MVRAQVAVRVPAQVAVEARAQACCLASLTKLALEPLQPALCLWKRCRRTM